MAEATAGGLTESENIGAKYRALDFAHFETRFFHLESGDGEINGELVHHTLLEPPTYIALSYCWGDPGDTVPIHVGGRRIDITKNLEAALRELRRSGEAVLWCDALCINQADSFERSQLVLRMGRVYSAAQRVVAWLGPASSDSSLAMSCIAGRVEGTLPTRAVDLLLEREYFRRMWIIQEIAKARDVELWCGTDRLPLTTFETFVKSYVSSRNLDTFHALRLFRARERQSRIGVPRMLLSEALLRTRTARATDPRDKLYAILGLTIDGNEVIPIPNYVASHQQILEQANQYMVADEGQGNLMLVGAYCPADTRRASNPSWSIDWADIPSLPPWTIVAASKPRETLEFRSAVSKKANTRRNAIRLSGVFLDTIEEASIGDNCQHLPSQQTGPDLNMPSQHVHSGTKDESRRKQGGKPDTKEILDSLWYALTRCSYSKTHPTTTMFTGDEKANAVAWYLMSSNSDQFLESDFAIMSLQYGGRTIGAWVDEYSKSRRYKHRSKATRYYEAEDILKAGLSNFNEYGMKLAVTSAKAIHVVHKDTRPGDRIWRFENCALPVVLRADEERLCVYRFIGEVCLDLSRQGHWTQHTGWDDRSFDGPHWEYLWLE